MLIEIVIYTNTNYYYLFKFTNQYCVVIYCVVLVGIDPSYHPMQYVVLFTGHPAYKTPPLLSDWLTDRQRTAETTDRRDLKLGMSVRCNSYPRGRKRGFTHETNSTRTVVGGSYSPVNLDIQGCITSNRAENYGRACGFACQEAESHARCLQNICRAAPGGRCEPT